MISYKMGLPLTDSQPEETDAGFGVKDKSRLVEAAAVLKDAAACSGIFLRGVRPDQDILVAPPMTLFPVLLPEQPLQRILDLQSYINLLQHRIAHDRSFLVSTLQGAASVDPFTRNLLTIYQQVDVDNQIELGLIRSDYMLHQTDGKQEPFNVSKSAEYTYKQVEINMQCVGLAGLSAMMNGVHNRALKFLNGKEVDRPHAKESLELYGSGLRLAYEGYISEHSTQNGHRPVLLIVVHDGFEFNINDQRLIEFESKLPAIRRSFKQIGQNIKVDSGNRKLFVEGREVAVVYYRTGYAPGQYDEEDWNTRLLMEQSKAVKCPSVAHQLSGTKKVQQELTRPGVLLRFTRDEKVCRKMLDTFMGQWDVSKEESEDAVQSALNSPERYVLKPNREGGGNNYFGQELISKIKEVHRTPEAQNYILMELIRPPTQENCLVRPNREVEAAMTVSEVGVFGAILAKGDKIYINTAAGDVLIRCKASSILEGGFASGNSCISSSCVV